MRWLTQQPKLPSFRRAKPRQGGVKEINVRLMSARGDVK